MRHRDPAVYIFSCYNHLSTIYLDFGNPSFLSLITICYFWYIPYSLLRYIGFGSYFWALFFSSIDLCLFLCQKYINLAVWWILVYDYTSYFSHKWFSTLSILLSDLSGEFLKIWCVNPTTEQLVRIWGIW